MAIVKCTFEGQSESLQHYGVLGMRWGVRHDKTYQSDKATAKKALQATTEKNRAALKSGRISRDQYKQIQQENKAKTRAALDTAKVKTANRLYSRNSTEANRRIQTRSTAKTLGLSALMGSYGTLHYDRAKSEGKSTGRSAVRGVLSGNLNRATGVAGIHNYLKDRSDRKKGLRSGKTNRRYFG